MCRRYGLANHVQYKQIEWVKVQKLEIKVLKNLLFFIKEFILYVINVPHVGAV